MAPSASLLAFNSVVNVSMSSLMFASMGAPLLEEFVRIRFSHGAAPTLAGRGEVVRRFLHVSASYLFKTIA